MKIESVLFGLALPIAVLGGGCKTERKIDFSIPAQDLEDAAKILRIEISNGGFVIAGESYDEEGLVAYCASNRAEIDSVVLYVAPDQGTDLVTRALRLLDGAGFQRVHFTDDPGVRQSGEIGRTTENAEQAGDGDGE